MRRMLLTVIAALASGAISPGADVETFQAYVDSDLCARLMPGPVSDERIECSRKTHRDGSAPAVVRLSDSFAFQPNKPKMLKEHIGGYTEVTGEPKEKDGKLKLTSVKSIDQAAAIAGPGKEMVDVRLYRATGADAKAIEKIRHELAMMPYISAYDFISFSLVQGRLILSGWTVRTTNRSTAENLVKRIEGVTAVTNNIEVLPLGRTDNQIRAAARAALQRHLSRYFWGSGSDIKIIVKNGDIILLGTVASKTDADIATIQCNSVPMSFHVFNLLRVKSAT